jgi:hypothetical protein
MRIWLLAVWLSASASADPKIIHVVRPMKVKPIAPMDSRAVAKRLSAAIDANDKKKLVAELGLPLLYEGLVSEGCSLPAFGILHERADLETFAGCLLRVAWIEDAAVRFRGESEDEPSFAIVIDTNRSGKISDLKVPRIDPQQHGSKAGVIAPPIR